jgi:NADPH:quinone reductase
MPVRIVFTETGAADVLTFEQFTPTRPQRGEAWIEQSAVGVNFLDVTHRNGLVPVPLPSGLGVEGVGVVGAVGDGVSNVAVGDRFAYALGPLGSYASARLIPADRLVKVPPALSDEQAASIMLKGLTAQYLLKTTFAVQAGTNILMYGVGGALGQIMAPWAKHLGARVIGVVSRQASVEVARAAGCDEVLVWGQCDLPSEVSRITGGKMADVVYDGVGKLTFNASLDCLRVRGMMVSIGATSGIPDPIDIGRINKTSLFFTRPGLAAHTSDPQEYAERARDVFAAVEAGIIKASVWRSYQLADVQEVHRLLEQGLTQGPVVLKP